MQRRGLLGGILAAPFVKTNSIPTPRVPDLSAHQAFPAQPYMDDQASRLLQDVRDAKKRLNYIRATKDAPRVRDAYDRDVDHITARKATSNVMKGILIRDFRRAATEKEAEDDLARALWKAGCPDWMKEFF